MSDFTEKIINYIDDNLSKDESDKFIDSIEYDQELKNEFLLFKEMNEYMKGKLLTESIEADNHYKKIEKETREDVHTFLNSEKDDNEVLEYLSFAFPERNMAMTKKIVELDKGTKVTGIDKTTEGWVNDINDESEKESDILSLINTTSAKKKNQAHNISFSKNTSKYSEKKNNGRRKLYLWTSSAAAIIILLFVLNHIFEMNPTNDKIFAEYHPQAEVLMSIQVRSSEQEIKHAFNDALELYKKEEYSNAYIIFHDIAKKEKNFVQAYFYSGLCQLEASNYNEAIQIFNKIISEYDEYELESKWFTALAYIKINKLQEAKPLLNDLSIQKSNYQEDAKVILKKLKD